VREFDYVRPADVREAVAAVSAYPASAYLAGGTTQVDLMLKDGLSTSSDSWTSPACPCAASGGKATRGRR
jgi:hypothetical protein